MSFQSPVFLLFVLAFAFVTQFARGRLRLALILLASSIFVGSYITTPLAAVPLVAFALAGYGGIALAASGRVRHAVALTVALTVAVFVWLKHYPFVAALPGLPFPYAVVGLSYILFRLLHLVLEVGDGALKRPSFPRYIAYLFFFPAFLSGPINRYEPFAANLDVPATMDSDSAFATLWRILTGFAKFAVVGECLHLAQSSAADRLHLAIATGSGSATVVGLSAAACLFYLLFLYANFSGYTDIAIAIGRLFGIALPENFNRPFMATNFQDLWSRWHITLSEWFKIYFFNPLLKMLMGRWRDPRVAPYLGVVALFAVFVVLGAWHGASWEFMISGLLLGSGVSINKLFQLFMTKRLGKKPYQALAKRPLYIWTARGMTLAWESVCLTPFWLSVAEMATLVKSLGFPGMVLSFVAMSAAFALGIWTVVWVVSRAAPMLGQTIASGAPSRRIAALATMAVFLALAVPMLNASTEFVYKAF